MLMLGEQWFAPPATIKQVAKSSATCPVRGTRKCTDILHFFDHWFTPTVALLLATCLEGERIEREQ
jgi:hypothetical protein